MNINRADELKKSTNVLNRREENIEEVEERKEQENQIKKI